LTAIQKTRERSPVGQREVQEIKMHLLMKEKWVRSTKAAIELMDN